MPQNSAAPDTDPARPPLVVVIAASAGGIAALGTVLGGLPADFPAPVLVVQHRARDREGALAEILGWRTPLRVVEAVGGEQPRGGTVYVAPADRHLVVEAGGGLALSIDPPEHFSRPAADPLFRSAAAAFGERLVAVVLTGRDADGSDGARAVHAAGGTVIAQDPATAESPGMPRSAVATGAVHRVLPLDEIPTALVALATRKSETA